MSSISPVAIIRSSCNKSYRNAHILRRIVSCDGWVDQNTVPNTLLVNEPSLSTQRIGGRCGR